MIGTINQDGNVWLKVRDGEENEGFLPGGTYVVAWGASVVGAIQFFKGVLQQSQQRRHGRHMSCFHNSATQFCRQFCYFLAYNHR